MVGWPGDVFKPVRMSDRSFASVVVPMRDEVLCAIDASGTPFCRDGRPGVLITPESTSSNGVQWCGTTLCSRRPQPLRTAPNLSTFAPVLGAPTATDITASPDGYFDCAIAYSGKVWSLGESVYGAVGNGSFSETVTTPAQVSSTLNFKALVSTNGTNCELTNGGLAYCGGRRRPGTSVSKG